jgi:SAM-dependent methyltransferase
VKPLDLYAKIEPLIGFDAQYERLYEHYCETLHALHVKSILDIGCGNGKLLKKLADEGFDAQGIERSEHMVKRACALGVDASMRELTSFEAEHFDAVIAVADVMNYMDSEAVIDFLKEISRVLKRGGFFLGDINTLYGFEAIADGVMVKEEEGYFLSVDASFTKPLLETTITLFTCKNDMYTKEQGRITQYFHPISLFKKQKALKFHTSHPIHLFSQDDADKTVMIFQKS